MAQFILDTQSRTVNTNSPLVNNFGDRNQVSKNPNGFNNLLTGMIQNPADSEPNFGVKNNPFAENISVKQNSNPVPTNANEVAEKSNTDDVLDYNSPDAILSQNSRTQKPVQAPESQEKPASMPKEEVKEVDAKLTNVNAETMEEAKVESGEFVVDTDKLASINEASTVSSDLIDESKLLSGLINPTTANIIENLSQEITSGSSNIADITKKIAQLKDGKISADQLVQISPELAGKDLVSQDEIDSLIAKNEANRGKNSTKIDAGKFELLKSLPSDIFLAVKDLILAKSDKTSALSTVSSKTTDTLNTKNTIKSDITSSLTNALKTANEAKAQTMLDSINIMLNTDSSSNSNQSKMSGLNGLTNAISADLDLKTQQYITMKGLSTTTSDLSALTNLNINLAQSTSATPFMATPITTQNFSTLSTPFSNPLWGQALNEQMQYFLSKNMNEVQLSLNPMNMGQIDIKINLNAQSELSLQFATANAEVQMALEKNMPQLTQMLSDRGIVLTNSLVQSTQSSNNDGNFQQNNPNQANADGQNGNNSAFYQESNGKANQSSTEFIDIANEINGEFDELGALKSTSKISQPTVNASTTSKKSSNGLDLFA